MYPALEDVEKIRVLVGLNVDKTRPSGYIKYNYIKGVDGESTIQLKVSASQGAVQARHK